MSQVLQLLSGPAQFNPHLINFLGYRPYVTRKQDKDSQKPLSANYFDT